MAEKISVIMPAYNVEAYIEDSIKSVLAQTYSNFELIVVNDGSIDGTASVAKRYQQMDDRVKYVEQKNQGVSAARNTGIHAATGTYIAFLDADDLWDCDALKKMHAKMKSVQGCCFVYGRTEEVFIAGDRAIVGPDDIVDGYLERFIHKTNELRLRMHISAMLIDRDLLLSHAIFFKPGIKISEDTGFMIEVLCATEAYGINDVVSFYMRRENSATTYRWKPDDWKGQIVIYDIIEPFVKRVRPEALPAFYRMRNYVAYRFILRCIREGFFDEVHLGLSKWAAYLAEFSHGSGKFTDKLKCRTILWAGKNDSLLSLIGKL